MRACVRTSEREREREQSIWSLLRVFLLDFRTFPTVCYFLFFILLQYKLLKFAGWYDWSMIFNATFNSISVLLWRSVLLVEETRIPGENHQYDVTSTA